ncbi:hypothetical protein AB4Z46_13055 [Variovorax sp. M-6]|uniref:aromatic-ring hydroxylase C-terminal domain-containing protein n=1 Tax=Variovorax sp. M-6 TaxID=3233041 RepID=UPI003F9A66B3
MPRGARVRCRHDRGAGASLSHPQGRREERDFVRDVEHDTCLRRRAPHFWLSDGRSLYDAFGAGCTLMRFDATVDIEALRAAAASRQVPLRVLDLGGEKVPEAYKHKLVLCRDDQHVAWRSNVVPRDATALVDRLRGVKADQTP